MIKPRFVIGLFICLLIPFSMQIKAKAANHVESSMLVYVDGGSINKVEIKFEMLEDNLSPIVFLLPFNANENNVNYDKRTMLLSSRYYNGYSICSFTPLIRKTEYNIEFLNPNGELYAGVTLNGYINNGQSDLKLLIPYIDNVEVPQNSYDYFISEFDYYYINVSQSYFHIQYNAQNRKVFFEESEKNSVLINHEPKNDVVFEFTWECFLVCVNGIINQ